MCFCSCGLRTSDPSLCYPKATNMWLLRECLLTLQSLGDLESRGALFREAEKAAEFMNGNTLHLKFTGGMGLQ